MIKKSKLITLVALFSLLLLAFPVGVLGAEVQTKHFNYTGGQQSWVVPNGVSSIQIESYGAAGGNDTAGGGYGGSASGDLAVTPGETIYFNVGGQGSGCVSGWGGGFNGGGNAGQYGCSGGGGGASDVRVGGIDLSHRVIVAGGGGGAGQNRGGAGGGTTNLVGLGQGAHHPSDGGGGGGGYYGGNYGMSSNYYYGYGWYTYASDTGGSGGSSYIGGVTNGSQTAGINNGDGRINISWLVPDTTAPTGTVAYSSTAATNQDVIATLSTSEPVTITNNGGASTYSFDDNGSFTFEFKDAAGNTGSAVATVSNIDKIAPTISIVLDNTSLWSPNHKMVTITAQVDADDNSSDVSVYLTSITRNEPDFDPSLIDDDVANDIQNANFGTHDLTFDLRAERAGSGNGRIYTVTYTAIDAAGNTTTSTAEVVVPHSNGSNGKASGKK